MSGTKRVDLKTAFETLAMIAGDAATSLPPPPDQAQSESSPAQPAGHKIDSDRLGKCLGTALEPQVSGMHFTGHALWGPQYGTLSRTASMLSVAGGRSKKPGASMDGEASAQGQQGQQDPAAATAAGAPAPTEQGQQPGGEIISNEVVCDDVASILFETHCTASSGVRDAFRLLGGSDDGRLPVTKLMASLSRIPYVTSRLHGPVAGAVDARALLKLMGAPPDATFVTEHQFNSMLRIDFTTRYNRPTSAAPSFIRAGSQILSQMMSTGGAAPAAASAAPSTAASTVRPTQVAATGPAVTTQVVRI